MLRRLTMLALTGVLATAGLVSFPSVGAAAPDQNTFSTANGVWNSRNPGHSWRTTAWNGDRRWQRRDRDDRRRDRGDRDNRWNTWNGGSRNNWNGNSRNSWNGSNWNNGRHNGRRYIQHRDRDDRR
ncbi:MAG: hypothetical protein JWO85_3289 [Candidatus Eremiobacteraeota bacterium]|jgi:hypothetical protein|nr:hypothetical protein [Candidatus Eremiobacteraeota bacterium]